MKVDILIAHPGKHHALHLVAGCVKSGMSVKYITPFYAKGLGHIVASMPGSLGVKAQAYAHPGIPLRSVVSPLSWQIRKLWSLYKHDTSYESLFDRFVAKEINEGKHPARVVVTLQDYMPETVKAAVRQGAKIWSDQILNQSEEVSLRVMRHEKESGLSRSWQHDESLNKEIIGVSELVTVPSNYCLEGIKKFIAPRTQTHLIPYGADEGALGRPKIENIKEVVVLARASTIRKGGHLLLQALPLCGQRLVALSAPQRVRIVILGDLETELKEFLSRLSLPEGLVVEHGNIPHLLMPELYREASLFLMPSLSEGMSLACIEAMHARLPMILSPYCGIDGFEHGRMGYETMDTPGSLASAMVAAFENRALWPQWGMNAKHLAEKLSWSAYENAIGQLAEKVFC